ncbi:unnamed protein product [Acanthoscelides obtectus]|uniref:Cytochrome c oxidase subunit n=1 Tax=Acanthoscelides obtectus TaxID=200917 RepID=A0A9P0LC22_ACAOB|nr:unnamed protein product [Acanthoscelides obtectus]CAK1646849.1 Cytochrome c oxidase subunit 6b-1 [Acanthoscelides obtectus]
MSKKQYTEISTVPQDARHHNCNATAWCFSAYVDHKKCNRLLGEGNPSCEQFAKVFRAICPNEWVKRWDNQIVAGTFPVDLPPAASDCSHIKK